MLTCSSNFAVGIYFIEAMAVWTGAQAVQSGYRQLKLCSSNAVASLLNNQSTIVTPAYNNNTSDQFVQQLSIIWNNTTADSKLCLWAYQNSGVSQGIGNFGIYTVRIK